MTEVAPARPSSTVVLARDAGTSPELFLVERPAKAAFGASYVFPGGVVEPCDSTAAAYCTGIDPATANRRLGVDEDGLDYFVAAIRELFEETGVLLAATEADRATLDDCRRRLNDASLDWPDFLAAHSVALDAGQLHYFSHWITPNVFPKRFTTRFFVAELPPGQEPSHDPIELTGGAWLSARDALDRNDIKLPFPTIKTLEALADLDSVSALVDWARRREESGVETIHPAMPSGLR